MLNNDESLRAHAILVSSAASDTLSANVTLLAAICDHSTDLFTTDQLHCTLSAFEGSIYIENTYFRIRVPIQ